MSQRANWLQELVSTGDINHSCSHQLQVENSMLLKDRSREITITFPCLAFSNDKSAALPKVTALQLHNNSIFIKFLERQAALPVTLNKA
jgi:hypothetical protein